MQSYGQQIRNLTENVFSQLPLNQPFLARNITQEISLQVMLHVVLGLDEGERFQKLKHLLPLLLDLSHSPITSSFSFFHSCNRI